MTNPNKAELRRLAEASEQAFANLCEHGGDEAAEAWHAAEEAYSVASGSSVVLALLDESDEWERLFKSAGNATKNAISDRDQLRAQVEALRIQVSTLTEWYSNALDVIREVSAAIHGVTYMDPPDGGDVSIPEQIQRMAKDAERYRWIREQHNDQAGKCWVAVHQKAGWVSLDSAMLGADRENDLDLDSAVRAAMSQEAPNA